MIRIDGRCGAKADETAKQREARRSVLVKALTRFGLPAVLAHLDSGDVAFRGCGPDDTLPRIGIELKKIPDLLTSMQTGRLAEQLQRMVGTEDDPPAFDVSYLLVEGILRAEPGSGIAQIPYGKGQWGDAGHGKRRTMYADVLSFLQSVRSVGVQVLRTSGDQDTLWHLVSLYTWWSKPWDAHKSLRMFQAPAPTTGGVLLKRLSDAERIIAGIPKVHYERARAVARSGVFANLREVFNGTDQQWQEVPGIGEGIAAQIVALCDAPLCAEGQHADAGAAGGRRDRRAEARRPARDRGDGQSDRQAPVRQSQRRGDDRDAGRPHGVGRDEPAHRRSRGGDRHGQGGDQNARTEARGGTVAYPGIRG